jgi:cytochrome c553
MTEWRVLAFVVALWGLGAGTAGAVDDSLDEDRMHARMEEITSDPDRHDRAIEAGKERALICAYCHGEDGNSAIPDVPNVAGQSRVYLLDQTLKYADGRRRDYIMQDLVRGMSAQDILNLTLFYASQAPKPLSVADPTLVRKGRILYMGLCTSCHGEDGRGEEGYSFVAGQQPQYTIKSLKRYRKGTGKRIDPEMAQVTKSLSDENIAALAAYLAYLGERL